MVDVNSLWDRGREDKLLCQLITTCGGNDLLNLFAIPTVLTLDSSFHRSVNALSKGRNTALT